MTRAAIYARVSSAVQRDRHTIENQLRVLPAFVASQGWTVAGTFVDDGRSAKTGQLERRDGFAAMMRAAELRAFEVVVVVDVDRLTRTESIEERAQILGPLQRLGIDVVTPSGGRLDMRTMLGELWVTIQAIGAAEENRKRAERIKAGKARAIAEGRKPAGPTPFGYTYTRATGTWAIDELAAAIVREIFARVAAGESCQAIGEDLAARGIVAPRTGWSRAAVHRIVRKRTALGEYDVDKARGQVIRLPPIISERDWHEADRALRQLRRRGLKRTKHVYLLEGIATCASCGAPISIRSATKQRRGRIQPAAYVCRGRKLAGSCKAPILETAATDARVWRALLDRLAVPEVLVAIEQQRVARDDEARDWRGDLAGYEARIARLEESQAATVRRERRGLITADVCDRELADIARELRALRSQIDTARAAIAAAEAARTRSLAPALAAFRAGLPASTPEQRRALLREMAGPGAVVVDWGAIRLELEILLPVAASADEPPRLALAGDRSYRTEHGASHEAAVRIRVVA